MFECKEVPATGQTPIKFDELTPLSCRFVVAGDKPSDYLFCGMRKKVRSYCQEHADRCYYQLVKKEKHDGCVDDPYSS